MTTIILKKTDITTLKVDAIVNAANSSLQGGGGVDGAIHKAGGPEILKACQTIVKEEGLCQPGKAVITTAGLLLARWVIHTVGPIWHGGHDNEAFLLAECYRNSLTLAIKHHCQTIAFPNISTGVYGYPKREAAVISLKAIEDFLYHNQPQCNKQLTTIYLVTFDDENFQILKEALPTTSLDYDYT